MLKSKGDREALAVHLNQLVGIIESLGINYYIHAGVACYLQIGFGDLSDIDIRVQNKMDALRVDLEYKLQNHLIEGVSSIGRKDPPIFFSKGYYTNPILQLTGAMDVDLISKMVTVCDVGEFVFPRSNTWFSMANDISFEGRKYKVASCEMLMIYYLLHRRTEREGKLDEEKILRLSASTNFSYDRLVTILQDNFPSSISDKLLYFYNIRVNKGWRKTRAT